MLLINYPITQLPNAQAQAQGRKKKRGEERRVFCLFGSEVYVVNVVEVLKVTVW